MLDKLKALLQGEAGAVALPEDQRALAAAALLLEVAVIDGSFDPLEMSAIKTILTRDFNISQLDLDELIESAQDASDSASSVYEFTQMVNQYCSEEEKTKLILGMWRIAYADAQLDKHEEYVVRKVADLIYVPHSEFIRMKHIAADDI